VTRDAAAWLFVADVSLHIVGAALLLVWLALRAISPRRDPLADYPLRLHSLSVAELCLIIGAYLVASTVAAAFLDFLLPDADTATVPGSRAFHVVMLVDACLKLAAAGLLYWRLSRTTAPRATRAAFGRTLLVGVVAAAIIIPVTTLELQSCEQLWRALRPDAPPPQHLVLDALRRSEWGVWGALQLTLLAVVAAPLAEEVLFRGAMLGILSREIGRSWPPILISGLVFGLIHLAQPQAVLPLATMGIILGYVRQRYDSLAACIVAHGLFNLRTMVLAFATLSPGT
jgi:membrane protease YdiL (CAAX protease family)